MSRDIALKILFNIDLRPVSIALVDISNHESRQVVRMVM